MSTSQALVVTQDRLYKPVFDPETSKWVDQCPYEAYQRNRAPVECRCRAGTIISDKQGWKIHIKNKTHQIWINNYHRHVAEADKAIEEIKEFRVQNEKMSRERTRLVKKIKNDIAEKEETITVLSLAHSKQVVECSKSSQLLDRYQAENKRQEQQIKVLRACYQKNQEELAKLILLLEERNETIRLLDDFQDALEQ